MSESKRSKVAMYLFSFIIELLYGVQMVLFINFQWQMWVWPQVLKQQAEQEHVCQKQRTAVTDRLVTRWQKQETSGPLSPNSVSYKKKATNGPYYVRQ